MARTKLKDASEEAAPTVVTRGPLTRDERRALLNHHMAKLRQASAAVELARAPFDAARDDLTAVINTAKSDLGKGYTRKRLLSYLDDVQSRLRDLMREEQQRYEDRMDLSLPVWGQQQDLFPGEVTPNEVKDELAWEAEGYLVGRRAGDREAPDDCPVRMRPKWLAGYDRGQAANAPLQKLADETIAARANPNPDTKPLDLNAEGPDSLDPAVIADKARKLTRSGFKVVEPEPAVAI